MTKNNQTFSIRETAAVLVPERLARTSYLVAMLVVVLMFGAMSFLSPRLPRVVPLYYSLPWGEARLAPKNVLFFIPVISLFIVCLNLALGRIAAKVSPLLPKVLAVTSLVIAGMMTIAILGIVQSLIL